MLWPQISSDEKLDHWVCYDRWWAGSPEHTASADPGSVLFSTASIQQPAVSARGCTGSRPLCTSVSALIRSVCATPAELWEQNKTWYSQSLRWQHRNAPHCYWLTDQSIDRLKLFSVHLGQKRLTALMPDSCVSQKILVKCQLFLT